MRIVFTASVMDLLHEGHLNLLNKMKEEGDLVLVVLHDGFTTFQNKKKLPIESLEKRTRNLIDTGLVDIIMHCYEKAPVTAFKTIIDKYNKFDLLFMRGNDWADFPGREVLEDNNIKIKIVPYTKNISSSKLRNEL